MYRTILFFVVSTAFSTSLYAQSSSKPFEDEGGSKTKQTTASELPPSISRPISSMVSIFSYPNPSKGVFRLSISNNSDNRSTAVAEGYITPPNGKQLSVYVKVVKYGSQKPVFVLHKAYPLDVVIDLTRFGQGTYYLTASTKEGIFSQRLLVE